MTAALTARSAAAPDHAGSQVGREWARRRGGAPAWLKVAGATELVIWGV